MLLSWCVRCVTMMLVLRWCCNVIIFPRLWNWRYALMQQVAGCFWLQIVILMMIIVLRISKNNSFPSNRPTKKMMDETQEWMSWKWVSGSAQNGRVLLVHSEWRREGKRMIHFDCFFHYWGRHVERRNFWSLVRTAYIHYTYILYRQQIFDGTFRLYTTSSTLLECN